MTTAAVLTAPCPVCLGRRAVAARRPDDRLGAVIPCPACTDATPLVHALTRKAPTP